MYFNFTPDETDTYTMTTCNQADFDTRLAVLTEACDESTVLVCLDDTDGCAGFTTTIEVDLMAGEEYTISVGGYSAVDFGTGTLTISQGSGGGGGGGGCEGYTNNCDSPEVLAAVGDYEFDTTCAFLEGDRNLDLTGFCDPAPSVTTFTTTTTTSPSRRPIPTSTSSPRATRLPSTPASPFSPMGVTHHRSSPALTTPMSAKASPRPSRSSSKLALSTASRSVATPPQPTAPAP